VEEQSFDWSIEGEQSMDTFRPTVGDLLKINAERSPKKIAVVDPTKEISLTYAEWMAQAKRLANALMEMGIEPGDRVAAFLRDQVELVTSFIAVSKIGGIFVPMNYRLSAKELNYVLNDCATKLLVFDEEGRQIVEKVRPELKGIESYIYTGDQRLESVALFHELLGRSQSRNAERIISEDDVALIMYTSGTTGRPKGTVHTHRGVLSATGAWTLPAKLTPLDRSLALGPLYHIGPLLSNFMPTLMVGGSNVIQRNFDPDDTLQWINEHDISLMWATPTHLNMLTSTENVKGYDLSNLRAIQYSGAPLSRGLFYKIRDIFGNIDLVNAYGMTELDAVSAAFPEEHDGRLGSVGRALPKTFVRTVEPNKRDPMAVVEKGDIGEIIVRSPCLMKEYWHLPDKTKEVIKGGWYFTGDLGRVDEEGYLSFIERQDDMIISGGENIYPLEVENTISKHKKVRNVAIIGTSDEKWGEVVTAIIVKADETLDEKEMDEYCLKSDELARYKRPRRYQFAKNLPTTSSGKVDKKQLREMFAAN
jgi:fatty-acyl-CoA synthase